ncbi:NmrA-like family domain-containing protein [Talaromyces proteolyticus]|uniref:NmrA-like family domain-containing protein n=1 Tax=Talaromyces proteolyticus TaxID=1131652 RepID=A0AAD4L3A2_9EURO|nr:NmrA-like family domain-containing protein [Talaromyces proteolyticus]KAH8705810.1 NmrA-like family domain-containing protein [Talaromyces proteolyticus]
MSKIITVFGATGLQGGSVIRAIQSHPQLSHEFRIRGVTRDPSKPAAKDLASNGVDIVRADLNDADSTTTAIEGSHTVFVVTHFEDSYSYDVEIQQGKNAADACKKTGIEHIIFSSLVDISQASKNVFTKVFHFDSKARIEQYIRDVGLPATFVLAGSYMQNQFYTIRKEGDGYVLPLPAGDDMQFPLLDVASDYGKFVNVALLQRHDMLGKRIYAAQEYYRPSRIVNELSEILDRPARVLSLPPAEFQKLMPDAMAEDLTEMGQAFVSPGYYGGADLATSQKLLQGNLTTWKDFVKHHAERFLQDA